MILGNHRRHPEEKTCPNFGKRLLTDIAERVSINYYACLMLRVGAGSSAGEHRPYKPGVTGSNPVPPTNTPNMSGN